MPWPTNVSSLRNAPSPVEAPKCWSASPAILRFVQRAQELLNPYDLASRIVAAGTGYCEFPALVGSAREYIEAESSRRKAADDLAGSIRKGRRPQLSVESREGVRAKAFAACDAFVKEYDGARSRRAENAAAEL